MPTLRLRDSLSERSITSRCLPAMAPRVLAMRGEVRSRGRDPPDNHFNSLFRSQPFTQLKPFECLFIGDAVSKRKDVDDEPGHGTRDEVERGFQHSLTHPA